MLLRAAMKLLLKQHSSTTMLRLINETTAPKCRCLCHPQTQTLCSPAVLSEGLKTAPVLVLNINNHRLNLGLAHCCLVVVAAQS